MAGCRARHRARRTGLYTVFYGAREKFGLAREFAIHQGKSWAGVTSIWPRQLLYIVYNFARERMPLSQPPPSKRSAMMPELMNHVQFRTALENALKGKSANEAPFSIAW